MLAVESSRYASWSNAVTLNTMSATNTYGNKIGSGCRYRARSSSNQRNEIESRWVSHRQVTIGILPDGLKSLRSQNSDKLSLAKIRYSVCPLKASLSKALDGFVSSPVATPPYSIGLLLLAFSFRPPSSQDRDRMIPLSSPLRKCWMRTSGSAFSA